MGNNCLGRCFKNKVIIKEKEKILLFHAIKNWNKM